MNDDQKGYGVFCFICLMITVVFAIMKASGVIAGSWWLVFIPVYIALTPIVLIVFLAVLWALCMTFVTVCQILFGKEEKEIEE